MLSVFRCLLIVLLVLALPLQGWAAVGMWVCAPLQDMAARAGAVRAAVLPTIAAEPDEHCAMAMHGMSGAQHATHADTAADGATHADTAAHGATHADSGAHGQCSVCALCTGAAMVSAPLLLDIDAALPVYGAAPVEPDAGFEQAGVERPPRLSAALLA